MWLWSRPDIVVSRKHHHEWIEITKVSTLFSRSTYMPHVFSLVHPPRSRYMSWADPVFCVCVCVLYSIHWRRRKGQSLDRPRCSLAHPTRAWCKHGLSRDRAWRNGKSSIAMYTLLPWIGSSERNISWFSGVHCLDLIRSIVSLSYHPIDFYLSIYLKTTCNNHSSGILVFQERWWWVMSDSLCVCGGVCVCMYAIATVLCSACCTDSALVKVCFFV